MSKHSDSKSAEETSEENPTVSPEDGGDAGNSTENVTNRESMEQDKKDAATICLWIDEFMSKLDDDDGDDGDDYSEGEGSDRSYYDRVDYILMGLAGNSRDHGNAKKVLGKRTRDAQSVGSSDGSVQRRGNRNKKKPMKENRKGKKNNKRSRR